MPIYRFADHTIDVNQGTQALEVDGQNCAVQVKAIKPQHYQIQAENDSKDLRYIRKGQHISCWYEGEYYDLKRYNRPQLESESDANIVLAPLTGKVIQVSVQVGQSVEAGEVLIILESMKMETNLIAPKTGTIKALFCQAQAQVQNGQILVELE